MFEEDDQLVRSAQKGNLDAIASLYNSHYPAVFRYIYYRLGDQDCSEDLAAEVFVRMVEHVDSYKMRGKPILAWLYTIAHNLVIDYYNHQAKAKAAMQNDTVQETIQEQPVLATQYRQDMECLDRSLKRLTEDQRQFILLRYYEGCELREIAAIMGRNERAIRSLQHRALEAMNKAMKQEGYLEA